MSFVFGELVKPLKNGHLITEGLYFIYIQDPIIYQPIISEWISMVFDNFIQLVELIGVRQNLLTLTCLLLIVSISPMKHILLQDVLYGDLSDDTLQEILQFAGIDYLRNVKDDSKRNILFKWITKNEISV